MDTGLSQSTVASARERLAPIFHPGDESSPLFVRKVNEVLERFHNIERWVGSLATFRFDVEDEKSFYLPFFLDSINSAALDRMPAHIQGPRYEFVHDGPGIVPKDAGLANTIVDAGVSGISTDFPGTPSVLTVGAVSEADAGTAIRILGYDADGRFVTSPDGTPGETVALAASPVSTATVFSAVKGVQKPLTRSAFSITHAATGKELIRLENWMTHPRFRCYRVLDSTAKTVTALCKRRAVPVHYEEDYILPGDLSALKLGLFAVQYEEASEPAKMQQYFREAVELLNQGAASHKGGAQEQMGFEPWGPGICGVGTTY